jgi:hypothetical protein
MCISGLLGTRKIRQLPDIACCKASSSGCLCPSPHWLNPSTSPWPCSSSSSSTSSSPNWCIGGGGGGGGGGAAKSSFIIWLIDFGCSRLDDLRVLDDFVFLLQVCTSSSWAAVASRLRLRDCCSLAPYVQTITSYSLWPWLFPSLASPSFWLWPSPSFSCRRLRSAGIPRC